jgi:phosphoribosylformylglycinamidine synthase
MPTVAVLAFPGTNCEYESARACRAAGLEAEIIRWNQPQKLRAAEAFLLAGGFSFEDRVRAGAIAAKEAVLDLIVEAAEAGKPVLGICNGAQVLLESGLVPGLAEGHPVEAALDANERGYLCRWCYVKVAEPGNSLFTTRFSPGEVWPLPLAHGEGRFTTAAPEVAERISAAGLGVLSYVSPGGDAAAGYPDNPNGSLFDLAGLGNPAGNVLALMPHPERASWLWQLPGYLAGEWGGRRRELNGSTPLDAPGPGRKIFESLAAHLGVG